jgi:hypothetical protein
MTLAWLRCNNSLYTKKDDLVKSQDEFYNQIIEELCLFFIKLVSKNIIFIHFSNNAVRYDIVKYITHKCLL